MKKLLICSYMSVFFFLHSCSTEKNNIDKSEKFPVTSPLIIDTIYTKEYVADIHAIKHVEIRARVHGEIENIYVDEGQLVRKGQILFTINDIVYREELSKVRAQLKNAIAEAKSAEVDLINAKILLEKNVISISEYEKAESKLEALRAKIDEAKSQESSSQLKLSFTEIKAPFDGIIDRIPFKMGSLVDEATLLTTISDNSEIFAYFNVTESEYLNFVLNNSKSTQNEEVSLILANASEHSKKGIIETTEGKIDKNTGNIAFRARFPNPNRVIKHGASGKVRLKNVIKNALVIPQKSTFEVQDLTYVFVVNNNNQIRMKSIIPLIRMPQLYIIHSGLSPDDRILYEGIQRVKDGDIIIPEITFFKRNTK